MRSRSSLTNLFFFYWSASFTYQDIHYILTRSLAGDKKTSQLESDARVPHKCLSVFIHSNSCNNFFHEGFLFLPDENFTVSAPAGPKTSIQVLLPCEQQGECFYAPLHLLFSVSSGSRVGHNKHNFSTAISPYWEEEEGIT